MNYLLTFLVGFLLGGLLDPEIEITRTKFGLYLFRRRLIVIEMEFEG